MFCHQAEYLGCSVIAVFYGFRTGEDGAPHAFRRAGVNSDRNLRAFSCCYCELHLVERERRVCPGQRAPTVIAVELDPVRAMSDLIPDDPDDAVNAIRL